MALTLLIMIAAAPMHSMKGREKSSSRMGGAPLYTTMAAPLPQVCISCRKALEQSSGLHNRDFNNARIIYQNLRQKTKVFQKMGSVCVPTILVHDDGGVCKGGADALYLYPSLLVNCWSLKHQQSYIIPRDKGSSLPPMFW